MVRGFSACLSLGLVVAGQIIPASATAQIALGAIGDSLSAEYQAPQSNYHRGLEGFNWVEILTRTRSSQVDFGPYNPTLDAQNVPAGFPHDYAIGGAMAVGSNLPQQVASAAVDVASGAVEVTVIWIGANDFNVRISTGGSFALNDPTFQLFQTNLVNALTGALDTLIAAGATDILLGKIPNTSPTRTDVLAATIDTNNKLLAAVALRPQVTLFDPMSEIIAHADPISRVVTIGGLAMTPSAAPSNLLVSPPGGVLPAQCGFNNTTFAPACPTPAYQRYVLNDDGAHMTTPMQGLVASSVIKGLGTRGFLMPPLSDSEILAIAGLARPVPTLPGFGLGLLAMLSCGMGVRRTLARRTDHA